MFVLYGRDAGLLDVARAVLAPVDQFAAPGAFLGQFMPHGAVELGRVVASRQEAGIAAEDFLARVTGQGHEGIVGFNYVSLRIGDQDAFLGVIENAGSKLQPALAAA